MNDDPNDLKGREHLCFWWGNCLVTILIDAGVILIIWAIVEALT